MADATNGKDRREYMRRWRQRNRHKFAIYSRAYRERLKQYAAAHEKAKLASLQRTKRFRENNVEARRIMARMHRRGRMILCADARELLEEYGPYYPLTRGLTREQASWLRRMKDREGRRGRDRHWELVFDAWEIGREL